MRYMDTNNIICSARSRRGGTVHILSFSLSLHHSSFPSFYIYPSHFLVSLFLSVYLSFIHTHAHTTHHTHTHTHTHLSLSLSLSFSLFTPFLDLAFSPTFSLSSLSLHHSSLPLSASLSCTNMLGVTMQWPACP